MKRPIIFLIIICLAKTIFAQDATNIYRNTVNSTVTIETDIGLGSGFFISENIIVTNYHVIEGASEAYCYTNNSSSKYKIEGYLAVDKLVDLILLKVSGLNRTALRIASGSPTPGQKIFVIGSPKGLPATISDGIISGLRDFEGKKLIQITAPISPGSSGGPVLNANGELIGVSVGQFKEGQNLNFAIPKSNLELLLKLKSTIPRSITTLYDIIRPFTDPRDEQTYKTVKIGNQIWMAENLNYATSSGSWCYNDNSDNCTKYGRLYNWVTAQSVCPVGWHLPSNDEWHKLSLFLDPEAVNERVESQAGGGMLKSISGWNSPNVGATNESGFSALPGGDRNYYGVFNYSGKYGNWWSSTEYKSSPLCRSLNNDNGNVIAFFGQTGENDGMSVRCIKDNTVTDLDGNVYKSILIGSQTWMAENLKTTKYNNGTSIPLVTDTTSWSNLSTPAYCWYKNHEVNKDAFGALYNWYAVNTGKLCPVAWHVPSDSEWTILTNYLGGESVAGGKLKESDTSYWYDPNTGATNETGFSARAGGYRFSSPSAFFTQLGYLGCWWSTTEIDKNWAYNLLMYFNSKKVQRLFITEGTGMSVRCVKD
jgi:uncharacterized protein (TIGR02145 family)